jgi:hypothetical protein
MKAFRWDPVPWLFLCINGDIYYFHLEIGRLSIAFDKEKLWKGN